MSDTTAMTVEEATRIRQQTRRGALDLRLPGAEEIVRDAERTCARADLWGSTPDARRRSALGVLAITAATVFVVCVCLIPWAV